MYLFRGYLLNKPKIGFVSTNQNVKTQCEVKMDLKTTRTLLKVMCLVGSQTALLRFGVPITGGRKVIESPRTATKTTDPPTVFFVCVVDSYPRRGLK
jgi:hypothetical protein